MKRRFAATSALALAALSLGAPMAQAIGTGNIDPNATGSLVIHKNEAGSQNADGNVGGHGDDGRSRLLPRRTTPSR